MASLRAPQYDRSGRSVACQKRRHCFIMKVSMFRLALLGFCFAGAVLAQGGTAWALAWSDEFNRPAGAPPDPANWNYDVGGGGWGNGEAQIYTNFPQNVFQDGNGNLVIRALRDALGNYTSARLQTGN